MKRNTRKGFTGIELVIVIAIIAILAAALIPAFGGLFDSANKTADLQAAREMDMAIKLAAAGEDLTIQEVIVILDEAGFDVTSLKPLYKHNAFYWNEEKDYIVLWDKEANEVVYPEGGEMPLPGTEQGDLLSKGACYFVTEVATPADLKAALEAGTSVKLTGNIDYNENYLYIGGTDVELDLTGFTLTLPEYNNGNTDRHGYVQVTSGKVTITGGVINARGVEANGGAELFIEGTKINVLDKDGGAGIYAWSGSTITAKEVNIVVENNGTAGTGGNGHKGATGVINAGGTLTLENCTVSNVNEHVPYLITNKSGTTTINGGTYTTKAGLLCSDGGTLTVNSGDFTWYENTTSQHTVYVADTGKVTIHAEANIVNGTDGGELDIYGTSATNDGVMTVTKK